MDQDILTRLQAQEHTLQEIKASVKKTEKYMTLSVWITVSMFVVPLLVALIIVPMVIRSYTSSLQGLL